MQFKFIEGKGSTLYIMENILINLNGANCNTLTVDCTPILTTHHYPRSHELFMSHSKRFGFVPTSCFTANQETYKNRSATK
jgi:hypothetical protein